MARNTLHREITREAAACSRMSPKSPLNGTKTHPLKPGSIAILREIAKAPLPLQEINAGVIDRLTREDLGEIVSLPSPYKVQKGGNTAYLKITDAGRAALAALKP